MTSLNELLNTTLDESKKLLQENQRIKVTTNGIISIAITMANTQVKGFSRSINPRSNFFLLLILLIEVIQKQ